MNIHSSPIGSKAASPLMALLALQKAEPQRFGAVVQEITGQPFQGAVSSIPAEQWGAILAKLSGQMDVRPKADPDGLDDPEPISERHQAALDAVAKGVPIIPCVPGGKTPLEKDWRNNALKTAEQVNAYFELHGDCNIALCPEDVGSAVIDIDPGADTSKLELPPTKSIKTPRGGRHLYYNGSLPPTVGKLAPHVDTRGQRSYVLIPPSIVNGAKYEEVEQRDPVALPSCIQEGVAARHHSVSARTEELDSPSDIVSARSLLRAYVSGGDVSVEGSGGNNKAYQIAAKLVRDYGLTSQTAHKLMMEEWNDHCRPPWDSGELATIVNNALNYGQNEQAAFATRPAEETFAHVDLAKFSEKAAKEKEGSTTHLQPIRFSDLLQCEPVHVQEIVPDFIEKGIVTQLSGPGGSNKSRLALQWGLSVQAGVPVFGKPVIQCMYVALSYEDDSNEVVRRVQAIAKQFNIPNLDNAVLFNFKDPNSLPMFKHLKPITGMPPCLLLIQENGELVEQPLMNELRNYLSAIPGHKFISADSTYDILHFLGNSKINETAVKAAHSKLERFCQETDSSLLMLWHPSRSGQERGDASGWSVAWENAPRARLSITPQKETKDAYRLKVEKRNHGPKGYEITLHWQAGVIAPLSESGRQDLLLETCIATAVLCTKSDAPISRRTTAKNAPTWIFDHIERSAGIRPTAKELLAQLEQGVKAGKLRYINGRGHVKAGYYPMETDPLLLRQSGYNSADRTLVAKSVGNGKQEPPDYSGEEQLPDREF